MLKKLLFIFLIILSTVLIAATCISYSVSHSITIGTMLPGAAGIVLAVYSVLRLSRPGPLIKPKVLRIIVTVIICIGMISFVAIESVIIAWAVAETPQKETDYAIVLGCGIFPDGQLTLTLKNRLDTAYAYLTKHEDALCVVSGGQGLDEPMPEAEAMRDYLLTCGIDEDRIIVEPASTSTEENILFSKGMVNQEYSQMQTAAIITSDFHVFRAVMIAKKYGVDAFGIAAPTPWYVVINCYMREYVGVVNTLFFHFNSQY